jgi:thiamine-phosphate diphosphorylase
MLVTDASAPDPIRPLLCALGDPDLDPSEVLVQVRLPGWPADKRRDAAVAIAASGAALVVNGDPDLARELLAGVHLPERAVSVHAARALLSPHALVGRSCHDAAGVARAEEEGATYITLGPIGPVPGKGPGHGTAWLGALARHTSLPVFALGGVAPGDVRALRSSGAYGVALMRALPASPAPAALVRELLDLCRSAT